MIVSFTVVLAMRFITGFLESADRYPAGHRILLWAGRLQIPGIFIPLLVPHSLAAIYCLGLAGVCIVAAIATTIKIMLDGYEPARYFSSPGVFFSWARSRLSCVISSSSRLTSSPPMACKLASPWACFSFHSRLPPEFVRSRKPKKEQRPNHSMRKWKRSVRAKKPPG